MTVKLRRGVSMSSVIDFLDRPGGHITVCLLLIFAGGVFYQIGQPAEGHDLIIFATGVLARSMMGVVIPEPGEELKKTSSSTLAPEEAASIQKRQ